MSYTRHDIPMLKDDAASAIIKSLDTTPDKWFYPNIDRKYRISHRDANIDLWVDAVYPYLYKPNIVTFGFWNRLRLRRAYRRWKRSTGNKTITTTQIETCRYVILSL